MSWTAAGPTPGTPDPPLRQAACMHRRQYEVGGMAAMVKRATYMLKLCLMPTGGKCSQMATSLSGHGGKEYVCLH